MMPQKPYCVIIFSI